MKDILVIEPFNGGSHGQLINLLLSDTDISCRADVHCLPAKKWQWRARTSALYFSQVVPFSSEYRVLFTTSVLNLVELVALRPDLGKLKKIVYFHENQLVYPVRKQQDRDFQFGYNQILTSLVADKVVFNSNFNKESFLLSVSSHLKLIPDHRPAHLQEQIRPKCQVLYFPLVFQEDKHCTQECENGEKRSDSADGRKEEEYFVTSSENAPLALRDLHLPVTGDIKFEVDVKNTCSSNVASECIQPSSTRTRQSVYEKDVKFVCGDSFKNASCTDSAIQVSEKSASLSLSARGDSNSKDSEIHNSQKINDQNPLGAVVKTYPHILHIVWPHRWEHDKDPETFFRVLFQLQDKGCKFHVSVIGETFSQVPDIFASARSRLGEKIVNWGFQSRADYIKILESADVAVSTAQHEFFGVSMLEAVSHGCYPLCPRRLVYPELYPDECLYNTEAQLTKKLKQFSIHPHLAKNIATKIELHKYSWMKLKEDYKKLLLAEN